MKCFKESFIEKILSNIDAHKDDIAISDGSTKLTYTQFLSSVILLSEKLQKYGIKQGDHVALLSYNSIYYPIILFSIINIGAVATLLNYSIKIDEIASLIKNTDVKFLIYGVTKQITEDKNFIESLSKKCELDKNNVISFDDLQIKEELSLSEVKEKYATNYKNKFDTKNDALIIFTSGTTSMPKAVLLSQYSILNNACGLIKMEEKVLIKKHILPVPLFHCLGLIKFISNAFSYRTSYILSDFRTEQLAKVIIKEDIRMISTVPTILFKLLENQDFVNKMADKIEYCFIGGERILPVHILKLSMEFKNANILQGYGLSENSAAVSIQSIDDSLETRTSTIGKKLDNVELKIIDNDGKELDKNEIGEIILNGPSLMNGYYKLEKSKQAIDDNGWLHTGDLGFIDDNDYLHFSGRIKDIIIRGGENISPIEIEKEILNDTSVKEAKVLGVPDNLYGERVEACLVVDEKNFNNKTLLDKLKNNLAKFKIPSHFIIYKNFPLNPNGKLNVRALYQNTLRRLSDMEFVEEINNGAAIEKLEIKNTIYSIVPTASFMEQISIAFGFDNEIQKKVRLAVEEFISERVRNAYDYVGYIYIRVVIFSSYMRIIFTDNGNKFIIDNKNPSSISAKIILSVVDNFEMHETPDGKMEYCMDFIFKDNLNVEDFLEKYSLTSE